MTKTGVCKFCGQVRNVVTDKDYEQDDLDRIASSECDCEAAKVERDKEMYYRLAVENINKLMAKQYPNAAKAIIGFVKPIQEHTFREITIKVNSQTKVGMKMNPEGAVIITRTDTLKDSLGE